MIIVPNLTNLKSIEYYYICTRHSGDLTELFLKYAVQMIGNVKPKEAGQASAEGVIVESPEGVVVAAPLGVTMTASEPEGAVVAPPEGVAVTSLPEGGTGGSASADRTGAVEEVGAER